MHIFIHRQNTYTHKSTKISENNKNSHEGTVLSLILHPPLLFQGALSLPFKKPSLPVLPKKTKTKKTKIGPKTLHLHVPHNKHLSLRQRDGHLEKSQASPEALKITGHKRASLIELSSEGAPKQKQAMPRQGNRHTLLLQRKG